MAELGHVPSHGLPGHTWLTFSIFIPDFISLRAAVLQFLSLDLLENLDQDTHVTYSLH